MFNHPSKWFSFCLLYTPSILFYFFPSIFYLTTCHSDRKLFRICMFDCLGGLLDKKIKPHNSSYPIIIVIIVLCLIFLSGFWNKTRLQMMIISASLCAWKSFCAGYCVLIQIDFHYFLFENLMVMSEVVREIRENLEFYCDW